MSGLRDRPVIVGVGEAIDRPASWLQLEPAELMAQSVRAAEQDAGAALLGHIDHFTTVNEVSWPYDDAADSVSRLLGIAPAHRQNGPVGGQTPTQFVHAAALKIQAGEIACAVVCGAEAEYSVRKARREGITLNWSAPASAPPPQRAGDHQRDVVRQLEASAPINVYPLYENALRAAERLSFAETQNESARLWSQLAGIAAAQENAWLTSPVSTVDILTPGPHNRPISWPYSKLMVANPMVNQGAAIIVMGEGLARRLGIDPDRFVYILGGHAAAEPDDLLMRERFDRAKAMESVLERSSAILGSRKPDFRELYSCFPVVPKLARRFLGLELEDPISVAGGLTFFGAPLNNYMSHAAAAMVRALRARGAGSGLLYAQGGYLTKHHTLVLSADGPAEVLPEADFVPVQSPTFAGDIIEDYAGPVAIETYTALFESDQQLRHGIVLARTMEGARTIARVDAHTPAIAELMDTTREVVGRLGEISRVPGKSGQFAFTS